MRVYINSSGVAPHHDYRRRLLVEGRDDLPSPDESETLPPLFNHERMKGFREDESLSVILVRQGEELGLLVTGLQTTDRRDYTEKRRIRNALACVGTLDEEQVMRGITVSALRGQLETLIDASVLSSASAPAGFEIMPTLLTSLQDLAAEANEKSAAGKSDWGESRISQAKNWLMNSISTYCQSAKVS